jgi:hypothetical protein
MLNVDWPGVATYWPTSARRSPNDQFKSQKIEEQFEYDGNPVPRCTAPALVVPTQTRTSPAKQSITPHE